MITFFIYACGSYNHSLSLCSDIYSQLKLIIMELNDFTDLMGDLMGNSLLGEFQELHLQDDGPGLYFIKSRVTGRMLLRFSERVMVRLTSDLSMLYNGYHSNPLVDAELKEHGVWSLVYGIIKLKDSRGWSPQEWRKFERVLITRYKPELNVSNTNKSQSYIKRVSEELNFKI